jgi:hypothetical protein
MRSLNKAEDCTNYKGLKTFSGNDESVRLSEHTDLFNASIFSNAVFGIRHKGSYHGSSVFCNGTVLNVTFSGDKFEGQI